MNPTANRLRAAFSGRVPPAAGFAAILGGVVLLGFAGYRVTAGQPRQAGVAAIAGGLALFAGLAAGVRGRWRVYIAMLADGVGDVALFAPLAWPLRLAQPRIGVAAVSALGLIFFSSYAGVRAASLRYSVRASSVGAPERAVVAGAALFASAWTPTILEVALWLIAATALYNSGRVITAVWRHQS